jgi:hypothetical protein
MFNVARHIAFGLYELLRNNAANIHEADDWRVIFNLIVAVGTGIGQNSSEESHKIVYEEDSGHGASSESESVGASNRYVFVFTRELVEI